MKGAHHSDNFPTPFNSQREYAGINPNIKLALSESSKQQEKVEPIHQVGTDIVDLDGRDMRKILKRSASWRQHYSRPHQRVPGKKRYCRSNRNRNSRKVGAKKRNCQRRRNRTRQSQHVYTHVLDHLSS